MCVRMHACMRLCVCAHTRVGAHARVVVMVAAAVSVDVDVDGVCGVCVCVAAVDYVRGGRVGGGGGSGVYTHTEKAGMPSVADLCHTTECRLHGQGANKTQPPQCS